eukprot:PRCOL_00006436-RA
MALRASTSAVVGACTAVESACDAVIRTANTVDTDLQTVERLADRIGQEAGLLTNRLSSLPTAALGSLVGGTGGGAAQEGGDTWVPPTDGIGRKEVAASAPRLSFSARNVFATGDTQSTQGDLGLIGALSATVSDLLDGSIGEDSATEYRVVVSTDPSGDEYSYVVATAAELGKLIPK